jgi:hypothetical protein
VAIGKALDALGVARPRYGACTSATPRTKAPRRLRLLVEAIDPAVVVLLDPAAAVDFARAFTVPVPEPGVASSISGRVVLATEDFAASLGDEQRKQRVWRQLRALGESSGNDTGAP